MSSTYLNDLLSTIVERGRLMLERRERRPTGRDLATVAEALVAGRGEASGIALASEILDDYRVLDYAARTAFFRCLSERFGYLPEAVADSARAYLDAPGPDTAQRLHEACEPRRQELIRRLNRAPGGTAALVSMREDLIERLPAHPDFAPVDRDFQHLLGAWFNRGFLVLRRIDWSTPASILEKIIRYEAVHAINGWEDLRRRIDPPDRRLYAFFHPAMAEEPLIFVEVALTAEIPDAIAPILAEERTPIDPQRATTAVFYSISNCQSGLRGISFGSFLIKQVVEELVRWLPQLKTFVTLSPVPGLRRWLERELADPDSAIVKPAWREALARLEEAKWPADANARSAARDAFSRLAAHYLMHARRGDGQPLDPVARFHLGNGAVLERINPFGDLSKAAFERSCGVMVNYRYDPARIEQYHEAYANEGTVAVSSAVRRLAGQRPRSSTPVSSDER